MQIQKIKLHNFRNFKDCNIEFSCDKDKNFTIVLGQNTFGKTTLVKSFIWCLYRINLFGDKNLLNKDVANTMNSGSNETCYVEIELSHKDCVYKIKTQEGYRLNSYASLSIEKKAYTSIIKVEGLNAAPIPDLRVDEEINNILRSDLVEYFFFDGESNSIDTITSKKNLRGAVSNILGLSNIELLKDYFDPSKSDSVTVRLNRELIRDGSDDLDDLQGQRDDLCNKIEQAQKSREKLADEIKRLDKQIEDKNDILDANKDVQQYQKEKKQLESDLNNFKRQKEQDMNNLLKMINTNDAYLKVLFGEAYTKFNISDLKNQSSFKSGESFVGITEAAVDQLIKRGKCICGCEIKTGNDAYNHLINAREHMEPHDFGKYIEDFDSSESSNVYNAKSTFNNINSNTNSILDLIQQIDKDEERIKKVIKFMENRVDTGEIQRDINNISYQKGQMQNQLDRINNHDIPDLKSRLDTIEGKISRSVVNNEKNDFIRECLNYANYIFKLADRKMEKSKNEIKDKLEKEVSTIFKSMYHGNRNIRINDDFKAETYVVSAGKDQKIDGSTGLGTVVNYSFVAGLMNLAKKAIINGDSDDETADPELINEVFPLVMDAPFSNTDEVHIRNICNALPNYCNQIIMFVMEKDFNYASQSIADKIGKKYELQQISETESVVKEVV